MKKRHSSSSFQSILFVICIIIAVAFLIQLGVDTLQLGSPTGAVVSVYELRDTFANIIGSPTTGTKIITGANPTQTASKVANYLASDYILCGNGQVDSVEDCEPSLIYSYTETEEPAILGFRCGNCRFVGDGLVTHISSEGLMEECDPGDADYIPSIAPVNSCSDNGVCQSDGTCPAGTYSSNLCAYGIYKTIVDAFEDSYYPYLYASGNLLCEEGEPANAFDCVTPKSECGITISDMAEVEFEGSREELIDMIAQEYGLSAGLAEVLLDAPSITVLYNEPLSTYAQFRLEFTMFPNSSVLVDFLNARYSGFVVNSDIGGYRVYVSNASNEWVWYAGNVLYTLSYEGYGTVSLTIGEKQQGNVVLTAYLNQFGSDVPSTGTPQPPVSNCGNTVCDTGEGQTINEIALDANYQGTWNYQGDSYSVQADLTNLKISFTKAGTTTETAIQSANNLYFGTLLMGGKAYPLVLNPSTKVLKIVDPGSCPGDCPVPVCDFDSVCDSGETSANCPGDCPVPVCDFDSVCDSGETSASCPSDCLASPVCGNSIVESGEQCDDGNTVSGDGCSSSCGLECIETDGGYAPLNSGTTSKGAASMTDSCLDVIHLKEYYCFSNEIAELILDCNSIGALSCSGGACVFG